MDQRNKAGTREATIQAGRIPLRVTLAWPCHSSGLVVFARSGRITSQDQELARLLRRDGMSTLLADLLPDAESAGAVVGVNPWRCAGRLRIAAAWASEQREVAGVPLGYLGLGVHAATALAGAVGPSVPVEAVVVGGGRPDLLGEHLAAVQVPTLLLTGRRDEESLRAHRAAMAQLAGYSQSITLRGSGPQFEEPGALHEFGRLAASWFVHYLAMKRSIDQVLLARHGRSARTASSAAE